MSATSLKKVKARLLEPELTIDLKGFSLDVPIVKGLGLLFVDFCILVCVVP